MKTTRILAAAALALAVVHVAPAWADEAGGPRPLTEAELDQVSAGFAGGPFFVYPLTDFNYNLRTSPGYVAAQAAEISRQFHPNSPYANSPNAPAHYRNAIAAQYNYYMGVTADLGTRVFANPFYWQ